MLSSWASEASEASRASGVRALRKRSKTLLFTAPEHSVHAELKSTEIDNFDIFDFIRIGFAWWAIVLTEIVRAHAYPAECPQL